MITQVGQLLKQERENQGKSLQDVAKETHIRLKNLEAIEDENWNVFPSRTYIQGVIKKYGSYLNMDQEKLAAYFRRDYERREKVKFNKKASSESFIPQHKRIIQLLIGFLAVIFLGFFGYQLYLFSKPPEITITQPQETVFRRENKVTLQGTAPPETVVRINGEEVFLDENNVFETDIPLAEEENRVVIEATGANGKVTTIEKTFIREE